MILGRFILRFILVPLAWSVAMVVGATTIIAANWNAFLAVAHATPEQQTNFWLLLFVFFPLLLLGLGFAAVAMMGLASIGMLFSEVFAIRSWIFHAANGGLSAAIGWMLVSDVRDEMRITSDIKVIVAAGLAAGLSYWLIAGWSAGFWKPVFAQPMPPQLPPPQRPPSNASAT